MVAKSNLVLMIVAFAFFMDQLDSTIVVTALPQIATAFHTSAVHLSTAVTGYIISLAVFIPISGWMADRFGASRIFRAAIVVFVGSSVVCGFSEGVGELTVARIFQGIGGAMMVPVGRLVVLRVIEKSDMVRAMSTISVPSLIGPVLGAPVGGFITTYFSWRWNFFINVPIGIVGFILATLFIPDLRETARRKLDFVGFLLTAVTLGPVMYGLEMLERGAGYTIQGIAFLAAGGVFGTIAVWHARRHEAPLLDLKLLRVRTFRMATTGSMSSRIATGAMPFLLPLLFQVGFGRSALSSGLLTFASALGMMSMRAWAKPILRRFGFRNVLVRNGAFTGLCFLACAFFTPATPALVIILILMVGGFFRAMGNSTVNTLVYCDIDGARMSAATSFAMMVNQLGNAFGVATGAVLLHLSLTWRGNAQPDQTDFRFAFICVAIIALTSVFAFRTLPPDAGEAVSGHHADPESAHGE